MHGKDYLLSEVTDGVNRDTADDATSQKFTEKIASLTVISRVKENAMDSLYMKNLTFQNMQNSP